MTPQVPASDLRIGDQDYRAFVGPPAKYDVMGALQLSVLTSLGLRQEHKLLDVGCGSLRAGRFFLMYLEPQHYFGIEPEEWLIQQGIEEQIGQQLIDMKQPRFDHNQDFNFEVFGEQFDFIIAQSIFTHASQGQIKACLQSVKKVLKKDGVFVFTYKPALRGSYEGNEWVYPNSIPYTPWRMRQFVQEAGLVYRKLQWEHPNSHSWSLACHPEHVHHLPVVRHVQRQRLGQMLRSTDNLPTTARRLLSRQVRRIFRI